MKSIPILLLFAAPPVLAGGPDVQLLHSANGNEHCYRIVHSGNKPLHEISVGSSWDGHPIADTIGFELVEKPAGWTAKHEVRSRHGFQFVLLTAPEIPSTAKIFPKGYVGRVCMRLDTAVEGMGTLPFAYQLQDYPNRVTARAKPDDGRSLRLFVEQEFETDALKESDDALKKAKDASDAVKKLKDLF